MNTIEKNQTIEKYQFWLSNDYFDAATREELAKIKEDKKEIEERFYKDLEFGTGGLRGIIGAGTNRINLYTIRIASQGLANYVSGNGEGAKSRGIVIAHDSRRFSVEFALEAAKVFCQNGIKTYLFDELKPTPELSFAVRELQAFAGIVVTASHNPKEYNGYKVYGEDGAQLSLEGSNTIINEVGKITDITTVIAMNREEALEKGLLKMIGNEIDDAYINRLKLLVLNPEVIAQEGKNLKIVYTPIHGTGNKPVRRILSEVGFESVLVVKEQEEPDTEFSTVKYPNPEEKEVFTLAINLAKETDADLIMGTDPDADRLGVLVKLPTGQFEVLTGNQTGCLLLEYILETLKEKRIMPLNGFVVKTIVTTELSRAIVKNYGVELVEVLTGFKFIGEQILFREERGKQKYIFGFEESFGYLLGTHARDKDAVVTCMLVAEMAAYYKSKGLNLYDALTALYEKYGYYAEDITNFTLKGKEGIMKIEETIEILRSQKHERFGYFNVQAIRDYNDSKRLDMLEGHTDILDLPQSNVLYYELSEKSWFCIRPSGTEPKLKIYYGSTSNSLSGVGNNLKNLKGSVLEVVEKLLYN